MRSFREIREGAGSTQAELARDVGVPASTVTRWEQGGKPRSAHVIRGLLEWCPKCLRPDLLAIIGEPGLTHEEIKRAVAAAYATNRSPMPSDVVDAAVLVQLEKLGEISANYTHGVDCPKVEHERGGGYLHRDGYVGAYDVDGLPRCGRCHQYIKGGQ